MPNILVTHHKCASNWLVKIFKSYCQTFKLSLFVTHIDKLTPPLDKQLNVILFINSDYEFLTQQCQPWLSEGDESILHMIRNPLDIIVSAYYSHLATHPLEQWPELAHQRDILKKLNKTAGMLATWSFLERSDMHSAAHAGPLFAMRRWNYSDSRIKTLTMEKLTNDHQLASTELQHLLGNDLAEILSEITFEKLSNGRTKGVIDNDSHYRCGQPNQWVDEMDVSLAQAVYYEYKEIIDTYYPDVEALLKIKEAQI